MMEQRSEEVVSSFFSSVISEDFLRLIDELNISLEEYTMPQKVDAVYNPTIYARHTFEMYVRKYCNTPKPIMYLGMNPGPWGMSQTGVPFGDVSSVRDWLDICGPVGKPAREVPARPVTGFACVRTEISGKRFWGLLQNLCVTPDNFFKTSFVYNYLPQQWMNSTGYNLTPGDFKKSEVQELYTICDPVLSKVLELYEVKKIIAIGKFCETRAKAILKRYSSPTPIQVSYLPHPSPRVRNMTNWQETATNCLRKLDLLKYYQQSVSATLNVQY